MNTDESEIGDSELLYRRIPVSQGWCQSGDVFPEAFGPTKYDETGISLTRANLKAADAAARGSSKSGYYLAVLLVSDIRKIGLSVVFKPETPAGYDPSHVEIPELRYANRKSTECLEYQRMLADPSVIRDVMGPFLHQ